MGFFTKYNNLQQAIFTFASVYFGLWLQSQSQKMQQKRVEKYYSGLLWHELRFIIFRLENVQKNFTFYLENPDFLTPAYGRYSSIVDMIVTVKYSTHMAFLNSNAVSTLTEDAVYNAIEIAYDNLEHLKAHVRIIDSDFKNKTQLYNEILKGNPNKHLIEVLLNDIKMKLRSVAEEVAITKRSAVMANAVLNEHLNSMGVVSDTSELRTSILLPEDITFIEQSIRAVPISIEDVENRLKQEPEQQ
ncbi:MAG TPA: hypothetical protein VI911_06820 [Patescibacteria group bacterium]|nr:hypothetical protein [Patescibacteria group bacterium]